MRRFGGWGLFAAALAAGMPAPCLASGVLVPVRGEYVSESERLPTRAIEVEALVWHGLARVRVEYRFQNEAGEQIEGLLRTRLPQGAVVTDFAYWFKGARVPGRIMENAKAEEIYRAITSARRDPALFRRKGDGLYEARIFPIEGKSELRVELEYCYALPEAGGRLKFFYPLTAGAGPIDRASVRVRFEGDRLTRLDAGPGSAALERPDRAEARWSADDLTPDRDLLFVAHLDPRTPRRERLRWSGPKGTYSMLRLRGPGSLLPPRGLAVGPRLLGSQSRFAFARQPGRGAESSGLSLAPFWAQARVQSLLARDPKARRRSTRREVIRLSQDFRIDTELTSYLAVPQSEWSTYQESLRQAQRARLENYRQTVRSRQYALQLPAWGVPGDPVIRVPARPGLLGGVALLPDGDLLPLRLDSVSGCWEARFDLPEGTAEGDYRVTLFLHETGGRQTRIELTYRVDLTPPTGQTAVRAGRLRVETGADTERVVAFLPDGSRLELARVGQDGVFETPLATSGPVRVRIYDRVHHWIELEDEGHADR